MVGQDGELLAHTREVGRRAVYIAKKLWPSLRFVDEGSERDRNGSDMILENGASTVQVKGDRSIAERGRLYIEFYEKTKGREYQAWRHSPIAPEVAAYIFVTSGMAIWVSVDTIAKACVNRPLTQISQTSMGFCLPLRDIEPKVIKMHDLWETKVLI